MRGLNRKVWLGVMAALAFEHAAGATLYCASEAWSSHTSVHAPTALAIDGDTLWMGSLFGGVLEWDTVRHTGRIHTRTEHCLPDNEVLDLSAGLLGGPAREVWIAGFFGVGRRLGGTPFDTQWHLFNANNSGLADPVASSVGITAGGEVWAGTFSSGGYRFAKGFWDHFDPLDSGLANSTVTSVETAEDAVWFGTWGGAFFLEDGVFSRFTPANTGTPPGFCQSESPVPPDQLGLTSIVVDVLAADEETGVVWIASLNDGTCLNTTTSRFDGARWLTFSPFNSDIASAAMTGATTAPDGREVVVSPSGSQFFDPDDGTFTPITFPDGSGLSAADVVRKGDELWFASRTHGVVRWADGRLTAFRPPGLSDNLVQDLLLTDPALPGDPPVAWVGNRWGAQQLVDGQWRSYDPANSPIAGSDVRALVEGLDGSLWFGTAGSGISRFDGQAWTRYNVGNSGLPSNNISAMALDPQSGRIWAAFAHEPGAARFDGQAWVPFAIGPRFGTHDLVVDEAGHLWFAGTSQVVHYDGSTARVVNTGLPSTNALALALGQGKIYVGTDSGAAVMGTESPPGAWQPLPKVNPLNDNIRALGVDAEGHLWAGAWDIGLAELVNNAWTVHGTVDGLTNNRVRVIRFTGDGSVWAGTEEGISVFDQHLDGDGDRQDINFGHAGGWYEPATAGQGFMIDIDPDRQFMFVVWFTFDTSSPQAGGVTPGAEQRWLAAQGHYSGHRAELAVYQARNGVFDEPSPVNTFLVGSLVVEFSSCTRGTASYSLPGFGLAGEIPITRLLTDEICMRINSGEAGVDWRRSPQPSVPLRATQDINHGLNGGWFEPATAGQGFMLDIDPDRQFMFVAWLTFDSGGAGLGAGIPGAEQRWLTAQGHFNGDRAEMTVFQTRNGVFDEPAATFTVSAGTMEMEFDSCSSGMVNYNLPEFGLSGEIPVTKLLDDAICRSVNDGGIEFLGAEQ